jgi:hypothetical protein
MTTHQKRKTKNTENVKDNSRNLLLEARENAINAKENAMAAVSRVGKERNTMNELDETLAKILDEAEQRIQQQTVKKKLIIPEPHNDSFPDEPIDIYPEIKRKTVNPEINRSQQLEQLIHILIEEKAQRKIEEIQEEARIYRIEAQTAINQARHEAIGLAEKEITKAREEIRLAKDAAENAVRQAREEADRYREEAATANNDAWVAISLAQERVKAVAEEIKTIQQQALIETNRARAGVLKAKEEAEIARRQSRKAISRAEAESRKTREEAEVAKMTAAEIINKAQEESRRIKEEAETSITRVNESLLQARQHIVDMTQDDISNTRQAIEEASRNSGISLEKSTTTRLETSYSPDISDDKERQYLLDKLMGMHNPLHSISGFARMILDDNICDTVAQKEFLMTILQQSENLKLQLDHIYRSLKFNRE